MKRNLIFSRSVLAFAMLFASATALTTLAADEPAQITVQNDGSNGNKVRISVSGCNLEVSALSANALRVRVQKNGEFTEQPELIYTAADTLPITLEKKQGADGDIVISPKSFSSKQIISLTVDGKNGNLSFFSNGKELLQSNVNKLVVPDAGQAGKAEITFDAPENEYIFGLGQFQDDVLNLRNQPRRLIQVNTQASVPMIYSSRGYGLLWHNYSRTDFNPADISITLSRTGVGGSRTVDVTTDAGGRRERRQDNMLHGTFEVPADGEYAFELDCGQTMSRQHILSIDGKSVVDQRNMWLPPVVGFRVNLTKGQHTVDITNVANDRTSLKMRADQNTTVFRSDKAPGIDFTVFAGRADEVTSTFRKLSGKVPMLPQYAFGYWHCRERYHNQNELVSTLKEFRDKKIPVDIIVQDWQWWDDGLWNSMHFDSKRYPDPVKMNKDIHDMNARLMLSVWSKTGRDRRNQFANEMQEAQGFIGNSEWIDFTKKEAVELYWKYFIERLVSTGVDSWWLDAVEPENDALHGAKIAMGDGDTYRNIYPLMVNLASDRNLRKAMPNQRALVLTRCVFAGQQRLGDVLWSGDVGSTWNDFRTQVKSGLNTTISGIPYWTTDAGGFFRPGNQYNDKAYHHRLIRWFEFATFCPIQRVHGYTSDTEPWRYGAEVETVFRKFLDLRYRMLPYVYSLAGATTQKDYTMMRPLVMDFPQDRKALEQETEYMFGPAFLVAPVVTEEADKNAKQAVYLPEDKAPWYNFADSKPSKGGQTVTVDAPLDVIPLFIRGGSILPLGETMQYTGEKKPDNLEIRIYPGQDGTFTLYEDNGIDYSYEKGAFTTIDFSWNDNAKKLNIAKRSGKFDGMLESRTFRAVLVTTGETIEVKYDGSEKSVSFK